MATAPLPSASGTISTFGVLSRSVTPHEHQRPRTAGPPSTSLDLLRRSPPSPASPASSPSLDPTASPLYAHLVLDSLQDSSAAAHARRANNSWSTQPRRPSVEIIPRVRAAAPGTPDIRLGPQEAHVSFVAPETMAVTPVSSPVVAPAALHQRAAPRPASPLESDSPSSSPRPSLRAAATQVNFDDYAEPAPRRRPLTSQARSSPSTPSPARPASQQALHRHRHRRPATTTSASSRGAFASLPDREPPLRAAAGSRKPLRAAPADDWVASPPAPQRVGMQSTITRLRSAHTAAPSYASDSRRIDSAPVAPQSSPTSPALARARSAPPRPRALVMLRERAAAEAPRAPEAARVDAFLLDIEAREAFEREVRAAPEYEQLRAMVRGNNSAHPSQRSAGRRPKTSSFVSFGDSVTTTSTRGSASGSSASSSVVAALRPVAASLTPLRGSVASMRGLTPGARGSASLARISSAAPLHARPDDGDADGDAAARSRSHVAALREANGDIFTSLFEARAGAAQAALVQASSRDDLERPERPFRLPIDELGRRTNVLHRQVMTSSAPPAPLSHSASVARLPQ